MATADVFGFEHEDLYAACESIERILAIELEAGNADSTGGPYFVNHSPDGPSVQIRLNCGAFERWGGNPRECWHPGYGVLVWVWGKRREPMLKLLKQSSDSLTFLETQETT